MSCSSSVTSGMLLFMTTSQDSCVSLSALILASSDTPNKFTVFSSLGVFCEVSRVVQTWLGLFLDQRNINILIVKILSIESSVSNHDW